MRQIQLTLYAFDELSTEAQKTIIERERWNIMDSCMESYGSDYRNSLEKFEELLDIRCLNWEVGYCSYHYQFRIIKDDAYEWNHDGFKSIPLETLSGKLLVRYLQNEILPSIQKGKYFSKPIGRFPNAKHIKRYSKVLFESCCPLTGYCYDNELLDPILKYLEKPDPSVNFRDLVDQCLQKFFKAWHNEYEYWADDEDAIREQLHNNQYEDMLYHFNGEVYDGPLEIAA